MPIVLSILAHPDDAEFLCAGTLLRLREEHNCEVHIATMTPGDCGSAEHPPQEISHMRREEGARAAALIGGQYHCMEERMPERQKPFLSRTRCQLTAFSWWSPQVSLHA